ncbi:MAG: hypothetical protein NTW20_00855 [Rhodobacterales bacterium]|nr:hypothetical protein [Rhodobacterales bacterium]
MALEVIGSGFGRTGTRSLKDALETLGYGPCHHMEEVFTNPGQVGHWVAIVSGQTVDLDEVFDGYRAQIDWPGAHVWREAATAYPEARVIHSTRPAERWWASFSRTIGKLLDHYQSIPLPPHIASMMEAAEKFVGQQTFGGNWADRDAAIAAFERREAEVRATIPADRLLVFDVAQGWGPLCAFLGRPVPDQPFPRRNEADDFWANLGGEPA